MRFGDKKFRYLAMNVYWNIGSFVLTELVILFLIYGSSVYMLNICTKIFLRNV